VGVVQSERMRAALEAAWQRHARALVSVVGRIATGQMGVECQAWMGVARSHEAIAAGLRAVGM
jgi:E3 ubiquitin-protein ligase BOI-like protein